MPPIWTPESKLTEIVIGVCSVLVSVGVPNTSVMSERSETVMPASLGVGSWSVRPALPWNVIPVVEIVAERTPRLSFAVACERAAATVRLTELFGLTTGVPSFTSMPTARFALRPAVMSNVGA